MVTDVVLAPLTLVLADAGAGAVFALVLHPLVRTESAEAAVFAPAPHPLMLAEAAVSNCSYRK